MYFEGRELTSSAVPVSLEKLKIGSIFYHVSYLDSAMRVPRIDTLVFAGENFRGEDEGVLYFQDYNSYKAGFRIDTQDPNNPAIFMAFASDQLNCIFKFEQALEELMKCSLRGESKAGFKT